MSGEGMIILELCAPESAELVKLLNARLAQLMMGEETEAVSDEKAIMGSLATKLLVAVLPKALEEVLEENDRLN